MKNNRSPFIVLYGANNLGKTEQIGRLKNNLAVNNCIFQVIKYPIYELEPTGPLINDVLRNGRQMNDTELQKYFAQNRRDYESTLVSILKSGIAVVAEDYKGTGIAWGVTNGISLTKMEEINKGLFEEDLAILLDGERFSSGREKGHRHEESANWEKAREVHLDLAHRYGWEIVNANQSREKVENDIWQLVKQYI